MNEIKGLFKKHLAQTTDFIPIQLQIERAEGIFLFDKSGKKYIDLISGVAVNNLGHCHPAILKAIHDQTDRYLHLMVYGEFIQKETLDLAVKLAQLLPDSLNCSFFVNSGSEAIEGAIKLSRLINHRKEVVSFKGTYHGSTLGTLNLLGNEIFKQDFLPLIPCYKSLEFNNESQLEEISIQTSCVILEPIQTASGMIMPEEGFLQKVKEKCVSAGALLIFDEIQTAVGRTGNMFAFETFGVVPDILCLAKSLGGGLPIGAFISSAENMNHLNNGHPLIGHATTFGGHPLSCATALATLKTIEDSDILSGISEKNRLFKEKLKHPLIKEIRGKGLLLAVDLGDEMLTKRFIEKVIPEGLITYSFLFNNTSFGIIPPLIISKEQINESCLIILKTLNGLQ